MIQSKVHQRRDDLRSALQSRIWVYPGNFKVNPGFFQRYKGSSHLTGCISMVTYAADLICSGGGYAPD